MPGLTLPFVVRILKVQVNHEEDTAVPELLKLAQNAALEALQEEAKATVDPETYARVKDMYTAITRRDEIIESLPEEYKPHIEKLKDKRSDYIRLRDAALMAAQRAVISAQDRYDSHDVSRVIRKLDILVQAENVRTNNNFILPSLPAGSVALERYNMLRSHLGTSTIPIVKDAPSSPYVSNAIFDEQR